MRRSDRGSFPGGLTRSTLSPRPEPNWYEKKRIPIVTRADFERIRVQAREKWKGNNNYRVPAALIITVRVARQGRLRNFSREPNENSEISSR